MGFGGSKGSGRSSASKGMAGGKRPAAGGNALSRPGRRSPAGPRAVVTEAWPDEAAVAAGTGTTLRAGWRETIERTVAGLHFELVDIERAIKGLLRVTIDRIPGHGYPIASEFVLVEDCELVTRQLQYALEVAAVDYARLEVSSPGLDRPLKREADYLRFEGQAVSLTLKQPFEGRKVFKGVLGRDAQGGWTLLFTQGKTEQLLGFALDEVREARLVPVLDFKGRRGAKPADEPAAAGPAEAGPGMNGG